MNNNNSPKPRVFISYSHDSPGHCSRVMVLANQLQKDGIDPILDRLEIEDPMSWPKWSSENIQNADFILCICTSRYKRLLDSDGIFHKGFNIDEAIFFYPNNIYINILKSKEKTRIIPLLLRGATEKDIPKMLYGGTWWKLKEFTPYDKYYPHLLELLNRQFSEKLRVGTIKVREAKLLLVGQGKAGKTTLKKKLENPNAEMPAPGDTTRGIEITRLDEKMPQTGESLRINVWDFGGQDIQHYAHQFFLTGNSLYALVTNERIQDSVHLPVFMYIALKRPISNRNRTSW